MPDFWRTELWHPVTVHFPIALLSVATLFLLISFFIKDEYKKVFQHSSFFLLILGVMGSWVGLYTGDIADGIVSRKLCDPTVLKDHELAAQTMTYLFTAAGILHIFLFFNLFRARIKQISPYVIFVCMATGMLFLFRTGHLGASVVYQQGGGVYNHTVDCDEY
jgi:uncharacterized membrane protein